ncbi:MAG: DivIVA domain-containing protein [Acidimicrobiia bacterium]
MTERASQHQKISTSGMLSPTEIAERSFAVARKGLSPNEVRSFLRRVADSVGMAQQREQDLRSDIERLEAKLAEPVELDERELLDALGEETARVLRSAQDAADAIRVKADERALRIVREAQEEGQRLRETTERIVAEQRQNAEDVASEIRETAERNARESSERAATAAAEIKAEAERTADSAVEEARTKGREMVAEARSVRERILTDLTKRRNDLEAQINALKSERERLVEAHRVVQRAVAEAGAALTGATGPEADAAVPPDVPDFMGTTEPTDTTGAESPSTPEPTSEPEAESDDEPPAPNGNGAEAGGDGGRKGVRAYVRGALGYEKSEADGSDREEEASASGSDVDVDDGDAADAIFAKLRSADADGPTAGSEDPPASDDTDTADDVPDDTVDEAVTIADTGPTDDDPASVALRERGESLAAQRTELAKALKRQLREDQNELLDALRKKRGKLTSEKLLPGEAEARTAWTEVVRGPATTAYHASGSDAELPAELLDDLVGRVVVVQRETIAAAIDDDTADPDEIVESIRARYREWKSASVDQWVDDILVTAHAQGAFDVVEDGTVLRWVVDPDSGCGPDCEDNMLEPTRAGEPFPTGQTHPPAYPGCRCLVVPLDDATAETLGIATSAAS